MNVEHPDKLDDLLALLKKHGVKHFELGSLKVEFAAVPPLETVASPAPPIEDEKCKCGHEMHAHSEQGFCLKGCEPDKCAGPEK